MRLLLVTLCLALVAGLLVSPASAKMAESLNFTSYVVNTPGDAAGLVAVAPSPKATTYGRVYGAYANSLNYTTRAGMLSVNQASREQEQISLMALSPDRMMLLTYSSVDRLIRFNPMASGIVPGPISVGLIGCMVIEPDNLVVDVVNEGGSLVRYDLRNGLQLGGPIGQELYGIKSMAYSPSGRLLALGGSDGYVHVFNARDWKLIRHYKRGVINEPTQVAWITENRLVIANGRGLIYQINPATSRNAVDPVKVGSPIRSLVIQKSNQAVIGCEDGTVRVVSTVSRREIQRQAGL